MQNSVEAARELINHSKGGYDAAACCRACPTYWPSYPSMPSSFLVGFAIGSLKPALIIPHPPKSDQNYTAVQKIKLKSYAVDFKCSET